MWKVLHLKLQITCRLLISGTVPLGTLANVLYTVGLNLQVLGLEPWGGDGRVEGGQSGTGRGGGGG